VADQDIEVRRKRLRYRSWHRGMKEADLVLGGFADRQLAGMSELELDQFERILDQSDPDLMAWFMRRQPVPANLDTAVMRLVMNFKSYIYGIENK
jgi:antitoxin CptB